jgi:hypothetical protein
LSQSLKKLILVSPEQKDALAASFFQNAGFELHSEFNEQLSYEFILDDFLPELTNLPRVQTKKTILEKCSSQVRAVVDEKMLNSEEGTKLLNRYYSDLNDFSIVEYFSKEFKNIYTLKVQDYLNIGYFIDTIVVEAYKNKFDHEKIREYLNYGLVKAFKIVEQQSGPECLDVSFSYSEEGFAVQIAFQSSAAGIKKDFESLREFASHTNFYDLVYFAKREKVIFSSAWFKKAELKLASCFFFTQVSARKAAESSSEIQSVQGPDETVKYEAVKSNTDQSKKLQLARKFSLFIKNYREKEHSAKDVGALEIADIEDYLLKYPRQDSVSELDDETKTFILKLIQDESLYQNVTDFVQKIAGSNLDSHVDEIQRVLGGKTLKDMEEIFMVKGSKDENGNEKTVVKGWTEDLNEEEWKVKRSAMVENIKDEVTVIKSQGRNVIEDDILRVVSGQLNANPDDVKTVVKGLVEEAVTTELLKKEKLEEAFSRTFVKDSTPAIDTAKEKLEIQVARMKKLMEQMKNEIVKLKNDSLIQVSSSASSGDNAQNPEVIELKRALEKTMEMVRNKEKMGLKLKSDLESIVQAKNEKIATLEMRIDSIKSDFAKSSEFANEETIEKLQVENKSLNARLELANRKINIINENMDKQDNDANVKKDRELLTLKTNMQSAQTLIEKFRQERNDFEIKLREEREKYSKLRDEKGSDSKDKNLEHEILISSLNSDKKSLEEKTRVQIIELKKMEQKLKFTTAQLEEAQKRKAAPVAASNKSNEAYIKQLEQANARIAEATVDLTEKKKEIHKLKQDNNVMGSKLAELEKKLAISEKKAA